MGRGCRVFISYSHDSPGHAAAVLALADRLRSHGIEAWIDQYVDAPPEGWPRWMQGQFDRARYLLAVCTPTWRRRFEGREMPGRGSGATWEGLLATQELYGDHGRSERLVPVLLEGGDLEAVPPVLRHLQCYRLPGQYEELFRRLSDQPRGVPPPVGELADPASLGPAEPLKARSTGAPPLPKARGHSPYVVGPPIERDEDFYGRGRQRDDLLDFVGRRQSVQILGERRMGKTSLLRWLERHLPLEWPSARVDAQGLDGRSPEAFVRRVGELLGRPSEGHPESVLASWTPLVLLVDEADVLTRPGHGFGDGFLDTCRALGQRGELVWVSAARRDVHGAFLGTGLASAFLNDARKVWVGALEEDAAAELGRELGAETRAAVGGWAYGLQWLGDAVWRGAKEGEAVDTLAVEAQAIFRAWWLGLGERERGVLRGGGSGRRVRAGLRSRGVVDGEGAAWGLWGEFVAEQGGG